MASQKPVPLLVVREEKRKRADLCSCQQADCGKGVKEAVIAPGDAQRP